MLFLTKPILIRGITAVEISYTMQPSFNVPQFKVLPNLMMNFNEPKTINSALNHLHSISSSV
jgi:hypothetical protein